MFSEAADASDIRLIEEVQAGKRQAFEGLVRKYMRPAHGIAMQFVQNSDDALDLSQEAFLKSFNAIDRFDTTKKFFPWFYRILRNTCFSFLRHRKLIRKVSLASSEDGEADYELVDESAVQPHAVLSSGELREQFWDAYRTLSLGEREILTLRHFQEHSYQAISEILDIPTGTVMSRLYNARQKLKHKMEPYL